MLTRFIILLSNPKSAPEIKELAQAFVKRKAGAVFKSSQRLAHSFQLIWQNVPIKTTLGRLLVLEQL